MKGGVSGREVKGEREGRAGEERSGCQSEHMSALPRVDDWAAQSSSAPSEVVSLLRMGGTAGHGLARLAWSSAPLIPLGAAGRSRNSGGRRCQPRAAGSKRRLPVASVTEGGMNRILFGWDGPQKQHADKGALVMPRGSASDAPEAVPVWELMYEEGGAREAGSGAEGVPGIGRRRRELRQLAWYGGALRPLRAGEDPERDHAEAVARGDNEEEAGPLELIAQMPPLRWARKVVSSVGDTLLPDDVEESYWEFTRWKMLQRVLSSAAGVLATQSMLHAVGVGRRAALPSAAAANWVIKDGMGRFGKLVASAGYGREFDADLKRHRFASSMLYQMCIALELSTAFFPAAFLPMASLANVGKSVGVTTAVSVAPSIARTFLKPGHENLAELTAKTNAQIVIADNVGLGLAVAASWAVGRRLALAGLSTSPLRWQLPLALFPVLAVGDLFCISRELRAVCFKSFNVERASLVSGAYVRSHQKALAGLRGDSDGVTPLQQLHPETFTPRPEEVASHEACAEIPLSLRGGGRVGAAVVPFQLNASTSLVLPTPSQTAAAAAGASAANQGSGGRLASEVLLDIDGPGKPPSAATGGAHRGGRTKVHGGQGGVAAGLAVADSRQAAAQLPLAAVSVGDLVQTPEELKLLLESTRSALLGRSRRYMLCARKFGGGNASSSSSELVRWDLALVVHEDATAEDLLAAGLHAHAACIRLRRLLATTSSAGPRNRSALAAVLGDLDAGRPLRCRATKARARGETPRAEEEVAADALVDRALGEALAAGASYADAHASRLAKGARAQGWDLKYIQLGGYHRRCSWDS